MVKVLLLAALVVAVTSNARVARAPPGRGGWGGANEMRDGGGRGGGNWGNGDNSGWGNNGGGNGRGNNGGGGWGNRDGGNGGGRGGGGRNDYNDYDDNDGGSRGGSRGGNGGGRGNGGSGGRGGGRGGNNGGNGGNNGNGNNGNQNNNFVPLQRFYNRAQLRHRFHTDSNIYNSWQSAGFNHEAPIGQIVKLSAASPGGNCNYVELFSIHRTGTNTQFMSTNINQIDQRRRSGGWTTMKSLGYCASSSQGCGAKKPLRYVVSKDGNDFVYTTADNEYQRLNGQDPNWRGSGSGVICYLY